MSFTQAVQSFFTNYINFSGRTPRSGYWFVILFSLLCGVVLGIVAAVAHTQVLTNLYYLVILIPSIALGVRRLHDIDRSGWWLLLGLIPIIGAIVLIVWYCTKGTAGPNRFGPDPLQA